MLSDINESQKDKGCVSLRMWSTDSSQTHRDGGWNVVAGGGEQEGCLLDVDLQFRKVKRAPERDCITLGMYLTLSNCTLKQSGRQILYFMYFTAIF